MAAVWHTALFITSGWRCLCTASLLSLVLFAAVPCWGCMQIAFYLSLLAPPQGFPLPEAQLSPTPPKPSHSPQSVLHVERTQNRKNPEKLWTNNWGRKPFIKPGKREGCWWSPCSQQLCFELVLLHLRMSLERRAGLGSAPWQSHSTL